MEVKHKNHNIYGDFMAKYVQMELYIPETPAPMDVKSHIFGNSVPTGDPLADIDDRYYDHSVIRHSPYFRRLRTIRRNVDLYFREGIFPERYNEEHPLYPNKTELYQRATLEISDDYKLITLDMGAKLCIYNDGYIVLSTITTSPPVICARVDGYVQDVDDSYRDFLLSKNQDEDPDNYFVKLTDFFDGIDRDGGNVSFIAEISVGGIVTSILKIDLTLQKITDFNKRQASGSDG